MGSGRFIGSPTFHIYFDREGWKNGKAISSRNYRVRSIRKPAQVKKAMEVTMELGGQNYVFWGGREGYEMLLNTDLKLELDNMARFLGMAVDYAKEIGFKGQFLIEPKPKEPTKH